MKKDDDGESFAWKISIIVSGGEKLRFNSQVSVDLLVQQRARKQHIMSDWNREQPIALSPLQVRDYLLLKRIRLASFSLV